LKPILASLFVAFAALTICDAQTSVTVVMGTGDQPKAVPANTGPSVDVGLASTPPMGWNSWNHFACNVDETVIRTAADQLVSSGMRDAGYVYLVIDDCWHGERDSHGDIQADAKRFPSGIRALAEYVHSKGLKFGIYSDAGTRTCGGRPGSRGYEFQDAAQYAHWGVDYLKYDWCNTSTQDAQASYSIMREALNHTVRPVVFSMCEWGTAKPWLWAAGVGNLWRTTGDIDDKWEGKFDYKLGLMNIVDQNEPLYSYAGPGHWNDPDMLEVGNGGMTPDEYRAHFSLWAMMAAPLMAGNDLARMDSETKAILMNREVIAVDQDTTGKQGQRVWKQGDLEVWSRELSDGSRAVLLLNRGLRPSAITVEWPQIGYTSALEAKIRDLWAHQITGRFRGKYTANVSPHGVAMITVTP